MPQKWQPFEEFEDRLEIAFWDKKEFLSYVQFNQLFGDLFSENTDKTIIWKTPSYSKYCYELAYYSVEKKDYYNAIKMLNIGLRLEPDHPLLLCELGLALNQMGKHEKALEAYKHAFFARKWTKSSILARSLRGQGVVLIDIGNLDEAEKVFKKSLELETENRIAIEELKYIEYLKRGGPKSTSNGQISGSPDELKAWYWFIDNNTHQLNEKPEKFDSYAANQPNDSPVYKSIREQNTKNELNVKCYLRWINKPSQTKKPLLQRILKGHTNTITSVVLTSDNKTIVSSSLDKTIMLWNLNTGECVNVFIGHDNSIRVISVSSDGSKIISGDIEGEIRLWNTSSLKCDNAIKGHNGSVSGISFLDGNRICSSGHDGILRIWDTKNFTLNCIDQLEGNGNDIQNMAIIPNSDIAITTSSKGGLARWNLSNKSFEIISHDFQASLGKGLAVLEKRNMVAVVVAMKILIIDISNGKCANTIECHSGSIKDIALTSDEEYIITGGVDRIVQVTKIDTSETIATLPGHNFCIYAIDVSTDGKYVVTGGGFENDIRVWDIENIAKDDVNIRSSGGPSGAIRVKSIDLSYDGKYILSTHGETSGEFCIRTYSGLFPQIIGEADYIHVDSNNNKVLTFSIRNGHFQEWNLNENSAKIIFEIDKYLDIDNVVISNDTSFSAIILENKIEVINLIEKKMLQHLKYQKIILLIP